MTTTSNQTNYQLNIHEEKALAVCWLKEVTLPRSSTRPRARNFGSTQEEFPSASSPRLKHKTQINFGFPAFAFFPGSFFLHTFVCVHVMYVCSLWFHHLSFIVSAEKTRPLTAWRSDVAMATDCDVRDTGLVVPDIAELREQPASEGQNSHPNSSDNRNGNFKSI